MLTRSKLRQILLNTLATIAAKDSDRPFCYWPLSKQLAREGKR